MKIVTVFDGKSWDDDWPPINAVGALAWFAEKLATVPVEFRDTAMIEIHGDSHWDSPFAQIEISYCLPDGDGA